MVNAISQQTPAQPVAQTQAKPATGAPPSTTPPAASTDSVQLSSAAQVQLAAQQEAKETPAQTSKEANQGDLQAKRLLAKESAAKSVS
jgi:hypothetical protein